MKTISSGRQILAPWHKEVYWRVLLQQPFQIRYVRIYEKCPTLEPDALAVLADAFELANKDSVDEVIRESGIVGTWRPSSVIVRYVQVGMTILSNEVVAHALWNTAFDVPGFAGMDVGISFDNDEGRERIVWPHIVCALPQEETGPEWLAGLVDDVRQLRTELTKRSRQIKYLEETVQDLQRARETR